MPVKKPDRLDIQTEEIEPAARVQFVGNQRRHERIVDISFPLENVAVDPPQMFQRVGLGVDVDRRFHRHVEPANLVEAEGVVDVIVREQDRIAPIDPFPQDLLTKIRRGVDQDGPRLAAVVCESDRR